MSDSFTALIAYGSDGRLIGTFNSIFEAHQFDKVCMESKGDTTTMVRISTSGATIIKTAKNDPFLPTE